MGAHPFLRSHVWGWVLTPSPLLGSNVGRRAWVPTSWTYPAPGHTQPIPRHTHPLDIPTHPGHTHPPGHIPQKGPGTRDTQPPNPAPSPSYEQTCENITLPQLRLLAVNIYRKKYITSFASRSPTSSLTTGREYM